MVLTEGRTLNPLTVRVLVMGFYLLWWMMWVMMVCLMLHDCLGRQSQGSDHPDYSTVFIPSLKQRKNKWASQPEPSWEGLTPLWPKGPQKRSSHRNALHSALRSTRTPSITGNFVIDKNSMFFLIHSKVSVWLTFEWSRNVLWFKSDVIQTFWQDVYFNSLQHWQKLRFVFFI